MELGAGGSIAVTRLGDADRKHPRPLKSDLAVLLSCGGTTRERALAIVRPNDVGPPARSGGRAYWCRQEGSV